LGKPNTDFPELLAFAHGLKKTPKPQDFHLYLWLPEPFEPFLTICSELHL